ncbi:D-alanine--D-alanine ligase, partial [Leptospira sp. 96542]|nr:D-alanine--D-alanine ligase [Leptospira sp. 96542]
MKKTVLLACDVYNPMDPVKFGEWESQETIDYMQSVISSLGYEAHVIENPNTIVSYLSGLDKREKQNLIVWNLVEGYSSPNREAYIPALCEYLGICHTGSDASTQILSLDKFRTKLVLEKNDINTSEYYLLRSSLDWKPKEYPVFVKPNLEGSSIGISEYNLIRNESEWNRKVPEILNQYSECIAEPFFDGNDLTVAVIGNGGSYLVSPVAFVNYPGLVYSDQVKSKE